MGTMGWVVMAGLGLWVLMLTVWWGWGGWTYSSECEERVDDLWERVERAEKRLAEHEAEFVEVRERVEAAERTLAEWVDRGTLTREKLEQAFDRGLKEPQRQPGLAERQARALLSGRVWREL